MRHKTIRRTAAALAAASAAGALLVGCGPDPQKPGAAATTAAPSQSTGSPSSEAPNPAPNASRTAPAIGTAAAHCTAASVNVSPAHQAKVRPSGTGTGAVVVGVTNTSSHSCTLEGFPTVAGAGNGSPDHNAPLTAHHSGTATPVRLAPGGHAWVKLTFAPVQGEGDGYCASGSTPVSYPTLVLGLPGAGHHQIAMDDGQFAECDNTVMVTALSAVKPA